MKGVFDIGSCERIFRSSSRAATHTCNTSVFLW